MEKNKATVMARLSPATVETVEKLVKDLCRIYSEDGALVNAAMLRSASLDRKLGVLLEEARVVIRAGARKRSS